MNELNISAISGLTPTVQLYSGSTAIGTPITLTEIGSTGEYLGSMPNVPYGRYLVVAMASPTTKIGSGEIFWDGKYEIPVSLGMLQGLDPNNPMVVSDSTNKRTTGDIELNITETPSTVTVTRV